jgi:D-amino-acid dehydrogenase
VAADQFVLACGSFSAALARGVGIRLPIYPVKGYSVTLPASGWNNAPTIPLVDHDRKIAVTRMGDRIRLAGTAEFAGFDTRPNPGRGALLLREFRELFPGYPGGAGAAQHWNGLCPMTPDGRPILGRARYDNLFLNTGHGPLGWTLACGSAAATAALIAGKSPDIPIDDFALARF